MSLTRNRAGIRMGDTLAGTAPPQTVALLGASISWWNGPGGLYDPTVSVPYNNAQGFWTWANVSLGGRTRLLRNAGVPGERSDQILARITDITGLPELPTYCVLLDCYTNDVLQDKTSAQIIANLDALYNALRAKGIIVVACTMPPVWTNVAGRWQSQSEVSEWVRAKAQQPGFILVDTHGRWADGTIGGARTGLTTDGVHPTVIGAAALGLLVADAMRPFAGGGTPQLVGMNTDTTVKNLNPMMAGNTGILFTGTTGLLADSWVATRASGSGTLTLGKVARTDNLAGIWQSLSIGGAGGVFAMYQDITIGGIAAGDKYQAEVEFSSLSATNLKRFQLSAAVLGGTAGAYALNESAGSTMDFPAEITSGVARTPVFTVDGTPTGIQVALTVEGTAGSVRVCGVRLKKVS